MKQYKHIVRTIGPMADPQHQVETAYDVEQYLNFLSDSEGWEVQSTHYITTNKGGTHNIMYFLERELKRQVKE